MNTNIDWRYAFVGFLRAIGFVVLTAVLSYVGDAANLAFLSPQVSLVVASLAMALEHAIEAKTGKALLGTVKV
jgi:hypothetical protein